MDAVERLRSVVERSRPLSLARQRLLPLSGPTEHLLPGRGLPRGWVVEVTGGAGATTLSLAMAAGPARTGSWVACVGFAHLGWEAAEEVGLPLDRVVAVHPPRAQWSTVVAALVDAFDLVLCGPEVVPAAGGLRRLQARARERGSVVLAVRGEVSRPLGRSAALPGQVPPPGKGWPVADARLQVQEARWEGLGDGWGHLGARRLVVSVQGRGELSRQRRCEVNLDASGRPGPGRIMGEVAMATVTPLERAG